MLLLLLQHLVNILTSLALPLRIEYSRPFLDARLARGDVPSRLINSAWSAALAFAPVRPKAKPKSTINAARLLLPGVFESAMVSATAVISAPPTLNLDPTASAPSAGSEAPQQQRQKDQKDPPTGWGPNARKMKPPSMILEAEVNGFKAASGSHKMKSSRHHGRGGGGGGKNVQRLFRLAFIQSRSHLATRSYMETNPKRGQIYPTRARRSAPR